MLIRYRTSSPMDFNAVRYAVVFNTSGNGQPPYANGYNTGYANYSFIFIVTGNGIGSVTTQLFQVTAAPGSNGQPIFYPINFNPQQVVLTPNSNGNNTEFTLNFDRTLFYGAFGPTAVPSMTPSPSTSPSSSPTPTPTPTATPTGGSPSPSPSTTPVPPYPTTSPMTLWYVNFITVNPNGNTPYDALGIGGAQDTSFSQSLNVNTAFDITITNPPGATQAPIPSAQLAGGEFINNP